MFKPVTISALGTVVLATVAAAVAAIIVLLMATSEWRWLDLGDDLVPSGRV